MFCVCTLVIPGAVFPVTSVPLGLLVHFQMQKESLISYTKLLFFGFFVQKYFQENFPTQWSFIKNLSGNDGINWPIGTLENVSTFQLYCSALQACLYVHSYFFFLIKVIYCRILLISLSVF